MKKEHEFRDPIYGFIRVKTSEREVIDSRAFQRLRHIHQLALTSYIYPGAEHKRFEHSLGVMELAGRVYDVVTSHLENSLQSVLHETHEDLDYWRKAIRMAALLHDVGHMPFSHAAESLLPAGKTHEHLTREVIMSEEVRGLLEKAPLHLQAMDVVKLALGPGEAPDLEFTDWETILAEIITGSSFGVDRMDYLLRDSYHAGVAYGQFDYLRLIDSLRILPFSGRDDASSSLEPYLGIDLGGLHSAEALIMARHWMFSQVYFHPLRIVYDTYLAEFLRDWLQPQGGYLVDVEFHLNTTDNEVFTAMRKALESESSPGYRAASLILKRKHHRRLCSITSIERAHDPDFDQHLLKELREEFGEEVFVHGVRNKSAAVEDFPVKMFDGKVQPASTLSNVILHPPVAFANYIFVATDSYSEANRWLQNRRRAS
jgi:HD superfamily phosphohydrolase